MKERQGTKGQSFKKNTSPDFCSVSHSGELTSLSCPASLLMATPIGWQQLNFLLVY
jgi:hypothetical protein